MRGFGDLWPRSEALRPKEINGVLQRQGWELGVRLQHVEQHPAVRGVLRQPAQHLARQFAKRVSAALAHTKEVRVAGAAALLLGGSSEGCVRVRGVS